MTDTPKTRDGLRNLIGLALVSAVPSSRNCLWTYEGAAKAVLDALEAHGVALVPMQPTPEMLTNTRRFAGERVIIHEMAADDYALAVAASPYRRTADGHE